MVWTSSNPESSTADGTGSNRRMTTSADIKDEINDTVGDGEAILGWISPFDFDQIQAEYLSKRHPGTLDWFFESPQYNNWLNETGGNLNCHGKIGTGKTILTSAVISDLANRFENNGTGGVRTAYFYCDFNNRSQQTATNLLRCLLRQLLPSNQLHVLERAIHDQVESKGNKKMKRKIKKRLRVPPSNDEVWHAFPYFLDLYSKVFIVLDAVDELENFERSFLFARIMELQAVKNLSIFYTSRFSMNIELLGISEMELIVHPQEVQKYVEYQIETSIPFIQENPALREMVQENILKKSCGSYVVNSVCEILETDDSRFSTAASYLDSLQGEISKYGILNKLNTTPVSLIDSYTTTMQRVSEQNPEYKALALRVLSWLTYAKRPLVSQELRSALGVEFLSDGFPCVLKGPLIGDMIDACIGLVEVDDETHIIRFVNGTTREYMKWNARKWFPGAESNIALVCIVYLFRRGLGFRHSDEIFESHLREYPFYDYAAHNWVPHLKSTTVPSWYLEEFLGGENESQAACQAMLTIPDSTPRCDDGGMLLPKSSEPGYSQKAPRGVSGLHLVAQSGLPDVVALLLEKGHVVNCRDSDGRTPLWWAAKSGHHSIMTLLAQKDVITLHLMLGAHEEQLARRVISCGYNLDVVDFQKRTPLHVAVMSRNVDATSDLISNGADIEAEDVDGMTPLQLGLREKAAEISMILLKKRPRTVDVSLDTWRATFGISVTEAVGLFEDPSQGFSLRVVPANEIVRLRIPELSQDKRKCLIHTPPQDFITSPSNVLGIDSTESPDRRRWVYSAYVTFPSNRNSYGVEKFSIQWSVVIDDITDHWRSMIHFTNLPHLWIPLHGTEFFQNFITNLEQKWIELCNNNQARQDYVRERIFHYRGHNPKILDELLEDGQYWFELRRILWDHVAKARSFGLEYGVRHDETDASSGLLQTIDDWSENITERIDQLEESSKNLIQLEFNLVSINEARKSTTTSTSMNRLSWITFFFLPLTFVSGLFGMNVDLLESNPSWWLYLVFASGTLLITCSVWVVFKRNPNLRPSLERRFAWILGPAEDPNFAPTAPYGL